MRILLDENLPANLTGILRALGHDVEHVYSKALSGRPDPDVRALAETEQRMLITQDIRFADARRFTLAPPHAYLLLTDHHEAPSPRSHAHSSLQA
jgi:predicted nuclease of predicted toxin-antitoxin system